MARNVIATKYDETVETTGTTDADAAAVAAVIPTHPPVPVAPAPRAFDPAAHLRKIRTRQGMQDYLDVKWRVQWMRSEFPTAQIVTEQIAGDAQFARFKCVITLPNGAISTGHGSETAGDFPDFYEKAETKSIGRACAALGYGTDAASDFDDGEPMDGRPAAKDERVDRTRRDGSETPDTAPSAPPDAAPAARAGNVTPISQPRPAPTRRAAPMGTGTGMGNGPANAMNANGTGTHGPAAVAVADLSNTHQHTQLRLLAEQGFGLAARMKAFGVDEIESLTREQAKELIIEGRATYSRQPVAR